MVPMADPRLAERGYLVKGPSLVAQSVMVHLFLQRMTKREIYQIAPSHSLGSKESSLIRRYAKLRWHTHKCNRSRGNHHRHANRSWQRPNAAGQVMTCSYGQHTHTF